MFPTKNARIKTTLNRIISNRQLIIDNATRPLRPTKYYYIIFIVKIMDMQSLGARYTFVIYALYFNRRSRLKIY